MLASFSAEMRGEGSLGIQEDGEFIYQRFRSFIMIQSFSVSMATSRSFMEFFKIISFNP
jgi:hypothetical protein